MFFVPGIIIVVLLILIGAVWYNKHVEDLTDESEAPKRSDPNLPGNTQRVLIGKEIVNAVWVSDGFGYVINGRLADTKIEFVGCKFINGQYIVEAKNYVPPVDD